MFSWGTWHPIVMPWMRQTRVRLCVRPLIFGAAVGYRRKLATFTLRSISRGVSAGRHPGSDPGARSRLARLNPPLISQVDGAIASSRLEHSHMSTSHAVQYSTLPRPEFLISTTTSTLRTAYFSKCEAEHWLCSFTIVHICADHVNFQPVLGEALIRTLCPAHGVKSLFCLDRLSEEAHCSGNLISRYQERLEIALCRFPLGALWPALMASQTQVPSLPLPCVDTLASRVSTATAYAVLE